MIKDLSKKLMYSILVLGPLCARQATAACTLYVSPSGDNTNGSSLAHAFKTPQKAEDYIESNLSTTTMYTFGSGMDAQTYSRYTIKAPTTVCIASGTYDSQNAAPEDATTSNLGKTQASSLANYTLYIKATGTPSAGLAFTAYDRANKPVFIQSGFAGIKVASTANWVTLDNLIVKGHAYVADKKTALGRYANLAVPKDPSKVPYYPYYDGNCITVEGNPVDYYKKEDNAFYPIGVPTHITIQQSKLYACGAAGVGAVYADYLTVTDNVVKDNAWWSVFGTSGLSALTSVDSEVYPTQTGTTVNTGVKTDISRNYVYGNRNYVGFKFYKGVVTDGEGIIIDTNVNGPKTLSDGPPIHPTATMVNITAYAGQTRISDNVVWNNGSSAIQGTNSGNMTISNNSTYQNRYYPPDAQSSELSGTVTGTPSLIATNPEINLNRMTGPINVWNNILYGPYPLAGHPCKSNSNNVTYTCDQISNSLKDNAVQESVNIGNNLYYGGDQPVDQPKSDLTGTLIEGSGELVNVNPQYTTLPVAPPTYGNESSDTLPNLRVSASSPAIRDGYFGQYYPYLGTMDITRALQPDPNENMIGAYAEHN